jgi:hypothetical protein
MPTTDAWRSLARAARRQRGLFTIADALAAGFSRTAIATRVERGEWQLVAPHVLRAGTDVALDWMDRLVIEYLSSRAIATGFSGLAVHDLAVPPRDPELIVVRSRRNLDRAKVHSTTHLPDIDITRVDGIVCTSVARSLAIAAGAMATHDAAALVAKAIARHRVGRPQLERRMHELASPGRVGATRILRALELIDPAIDRARNEWEGLLVETALAFGLPAPILNYRVRLEGRIRYLDAAWTPVRIFAEFDGFLEHLLSRERFTDDRVRQNDAVAAGWWPFRFTSDQLRPEQRGRSFEQLARTYHRLAGAA